MANRLRRSGVVYVPGISERFSSALGEIQHPGAKPLAQDSDLAGLLGLAGELYAGAL